MIMQIFMIWSYKKKTLKREKRTIQMAYFFQ